MVSQKQLSSALRFCCCMVKASSGPITHTTKSGLLTHVHHFTLDFTCLFIRACSQVFLPACLLSSQEKTRNQVGLYSCLQETGQVSRQRCWKAVLGLRWPQRALCLSALNLHRIRKGLHIHIPGVPGIQIPCVSILGAEGGLAWGSLR